MSSLEFFDFQNLLYSAEYSHFPPVIPLNKATEIKLVEKTLRQPFCLA